MTDVCVAPLNGRSPVAISWSTMPMEKMSDRVIDRFTFRLLRGHVGDGADKRAVSGEVRWLETRCAIRFADSFPESRQPEIQDLDPTFGRDHDIPRFQVAVSNATLVSRRHSFRDAPRQRDQSR